MTFSTADADSCSTMAGWIARLREAGEVLALLVAIVMAAGLLCAMEIYVLKECIDGLRRPACLNYCPPPPHVFAGDTLHLNLDDLHDRIALGDPHFCQRCHEDFPRLWDT